MGAPKEDIQPEILDNLKKLNIRQAETNRLLKKLVEKKEEEK